MPPRKAGGRKRKRRTEVEPGLLEKNDQGEEDKQSVDGQPSVPCLTYATHKNDSNPPSARTRPRYEHRERHSGH